MGLDGIIWSCSDRFGSFTSDGAEVSPMRIYVIKLPWFLGRLIRMFRRKDYR